MTFTKSLDAYAKLTGIVHSSSTRKVRAVQILFNRGSIKEVNYHTLIVRTDNKKDGYLVKKDKDDNYTCECMDYLRRELDCKHILAGKEYWKLLEHDKAKRCFRKLIPHYGRTQRGLTTTQKVEDVTCPRCWELMREQIVEEL